MKYKCIIFDCDGVLVDSEEISSTILVEMANAEGAKIDINYALQNFAGGSLKNAFDLIEKLIEKELPTQFENEFRERSFKVFKTDLKPVEGIYNLLSQLSVPYCVASNGPIDKIKLNLTTTNLIEQFQNRIFSAYEIGSWKPNPELFLYAAQKMGFKPSECVVIEDSISGIRAAKRGGFDVYGFVTKKNGQTFEKEGAIPFYNMESLLEILRK